MLTKAERLIAIKITVPAEAGHRAVNYWRNFEPPPLSHLELGNNLENLDFIILNFDVLKQ